MKRYLTILLAVLFIGFAGLGIHDLRNTKELKARNEIELQDTLIEAKQLELQKRELNQKFDEAVKEKDINEEKVRQLEQEKLELEERYRQLEISKANEKAEQERIAKASRLQSTSTQVAGATTRNNVTGNKETWLRASGIPEKHWWAVDSIVSGESGWNPTAVNPSSGACGLGQQLPCGKWGGDWKDPIHALKSMNTYVQAYGGWSEAVSFRNCTGKCWSNRTNSYVDKSHTWY